MTTLSNVVSCASWFVSFLHELKNSINSGMNGRYFILVRVSGYKISIGNKGSELKNIKKSDLAFHFAEGDFSNAEVRSKVFGRNALN